MKKFFLTLILILLVGLCVLFSTILHNDQLADKYVVLIINEKSTTSRARINKNAIELPLIEVIQGLGYPINCVDDNVLNIVVNNKLFTLEKESLTLMESGDTMNLLISPPGNSFFSCVLMDDDIWLDNITLKGVLYTMGILVDITYSSGDQRVTISARSS